MFSIVAAAPDRHRVRPTSNPNVRWVEQGRPFAIVKFHRDIKSSVTETRDIESSLLAFGEMLEASSNGSPSLPL
jgi:hypothetical protein